MKETYPRYKQGEVEKIEKKLSRTDKKLIDEFCKQCLITASEEKVKKIKRHILQFFDITETPLSKQTKDTVIAFLIILNNSDRSAWTKNEIKCYLKKFLKLHYKDLGMIENIKRQTIDIDHSKINENNLVTEEEVEKMLRFAESYKEKAYLFLIFESGCRPQEAVNLKWSDIKFEDNYADITFYSNKTRKSRNFPVKRAKEFLWYWKENYCYPNLKHSDYVFVNPRNRNKPMTTAGLNKMLRRLSSKAGINKDVYNYLYRHSTATRLYETLPTPVCEKLLGHKNMAKIYAHISNKKARELMLEKIYKVEELSTGTKHQLENEIKQLNRKLEKYETLTKRLKVLLPAIEDYFKEKKIL